MADGDQKVEYAVQCADSEIHWSGIPDAAGIAFVDRYCGCGPHRLVQRTVTSWSPVDRKEGDDT